MGVRIPLIGLTMRGPTRVRNTQAAIDRGISQGIFQLGHFARSADPFDLVIMINRYARGVITAVFQTL